MKLDILKTIQKYEFIYFVQLGQGSVNLTDSLSRAKINCLQAERVGKDKSALKDIVSTCGNPGLPFLPKSESCSPSSNIPQIPVKHLVTVSFKETAD